MVKYEYLIRRNDRVDESWEFQDKIYRDWSFLKMLNYVGSFGWELAIKENENIYILKRR